MKISSTVVILIVALLVVIADERLGLGLVAFLGDYFVVLLLLAIIVGAFGIKTKI